MSFEQEVRDKVAGLLQDLLDAPGPENFEVVLSQLTRMAILGTAPPVCRPKTSQQEQKQAASRFDDSFSLDKESFIAP